jgi:hypothetical protein
VVKHEVRGVWKRQPFANFCGIGDQYAVGLDQWRRFLRDEARELVIDGDMRELSA